MGKQARPDQMMKARASGLRNLPFLITTTQVRCGSSVAGYALPRARGMPQRGSQTSCALRTTNVPIVPTFIDYLTKTFTVDSLFETTGDTEANMTRVRTMFAWYQGKHRGALSLTPVNR